MAVDLRNCDRDLKILIQTRYKNWSFIYDFVDDYSLSMGNSTSSANISYATDATDHVSRNQDTVTINGTIGCIKGCGSMRSISNGFNYIERALKELKEEMLYSRDRFCVLTFPDFVFTNAVLTSVSVANNRDTTQLKSITTTWTGLNMGGLVQDPVFYRGGVQI